MISNPQDYISEYQQAGADIFTVHAEVCHHLHRVLQAVQETGMQTGVALNPHTPISVLEHVIEQIDLVCMMSVNPGFGGQKFIETTYQKVRNLKELIKTNNANTKIEIDGGVSEKNAKQLLDAGADVLVAGSAVFKADNPRQVIHKLKTIA